ncbi:M15 family metallopeptidase [Heyndrickxia acidicola]|uniref:M15 family metallopeptidase n=1 Tax=Heyndrickxia acidicola TaxID=209389 RepID=A0ABU6MLL9_9BACI|nr:M15 family metallopeptidase [Heyndrickxia acidicola]MED1205389.1 M15 family metallopeptidase [Heyndrickxia acidicola]
MKKVLSISAIAFLLGGCSFAQHHNQTEKPKTGNQSNTIQSTANNGDNGLTLQSQYFNKVQKGKGHNTIENPANILALVNKDNYLPSDYAPKDLVRPNVAFSFGNADVEKAHMRKEAAVALAKMFNDAKKDGIILYAASGYRSYTRQMSVFKDEVDNSGQKQADQAVAIPGSSEHQTGLAMDITCQSEQFLLTDHFGEDKEGKWLMDNAHKYGFILRYPKNKINITHYEYEPWHYRYVGTKAANVMYQHDWTLEEYFEHVKKI